MKEAATDHGRDEHGKSNPAGFEMETLVGYILLTGVVSSILLLVAGAAWQWFIHGTPEFDLTIRDQNLWEFLVTSLRGLTSGAVRPQTFINLGLSVLLLTPFVRVLASMLFFLLVERDWKYSVFTFFVLSVLSYSLFLR